MARMLGAVWLQSFPKVLNGLDQSLCGRDDVDEEDEEMFTDGAGWMET